MGYRKGDRVVDAHGNTYKILAVERGGRIAVKATDYNEPSKVLHSNDVQPEPVATSEPSPKKGWFRH